MHAALLPLIKELTTITELGSIHSVLSWDQETYMPQGAIEPRAAALSLIAGLCHDRHTSQTFTDLLKTVVDIKTGEPFLADLSPQEHRMLQEIHRDWRMANTLPTDFVTRYSSLQSQSQYHWQKARQANDFSIFAPYLDKVIAMTRQKADYFGWQYTPYNALLDEYEPGATTTALTPLFTRLKEAIIPLLHTIQKKDTFSALPKGPYDKAIQLKFSHFLLREMGFEFDHGRLDISTHPFTTQFHPTDVRITTRFNESDVMEGISGTLHEGGHALYEQGLDPARFGTPLGAAVSLGIHESQSRLWENFIGKSPAFWQHYLPQLQSAFPPLANVPFADFYQAINQVKPSFIRVESDELTYNLHILIRYEIEQLIFQDQIPVQELPELWNQKYEEYLGITPPDDAHGILQDVHWSMGAFGYFPTYTLGNFYAAQLWETLLSAFPALEQNIQNGDLIQVRGWLKTHIHRLGKEKPAETLMAELTGQPLSEKAFVSYITKKYNQIYGL